MPIARNGSFLGDVTDQIQGMLFPLAARQTLDLLDFQEANEIKGGVLEIGVFCGKSISRCCFIPLTLLAVRLSASTPSNSHRRTRF